MRFESKEGHIVSVYMSTRIRGKGVAIVPDGRGNVP